MLISSILDQIGNIRYRLMDEVSFTNLAMMISGYGADDSVVFAADPKYIKRLDDRVRMVLTTEEYADLIHDKGYGVCVVDDPRSVFYMIHGYLSNTSGYCRESFPTRIGSGCNISSMTDISDTGVAIGDNVTIEPFVSIKAGTEIGDNVIIRSGVAIGGPGYDYRDLGEGLQMTPQMGGVKIGHDVEINSNTCIERATFPYEDTLIGDHCKIGALCYIAHGVRLGSRVLMPNCASVSGYTVIGDDVSVGPGATITNVTAIGENAHITLGAVVCNRVKQGNTVSGNPAIPHDRFLEQYHSSLLGSSGHE